MDLLHATLWLLNRFIATVVDSKHRPAADYVELSKSLHGIRD